MLGDGDLAEMIRRKLELFPGHASGARRRARDRGLRRARRRRRPGDLRLRPDGAGRGRRPRRALPRAPGEAERDLAAARPRRAGAPGAGRRPAGARVRDLGPVALDGADQARLRHRGLERRAADHRPVLPADRARDQARQPRPRVLQPDPRRPRRAAVPDAQVPDHGRRRRGSAAGRRPPRRPPRPGVQALRRSPRDPRRALPAPAQPRRAARS